MTIGCDAMTAVSVIANASNKEATQSLLRHMAQVLSHRGEILLSKAYCDTVTHGIVVQSHRPQVPMIREGKDWLTIIDHVCRTPLPSSGTATVIHLEKDRLRVSRQRFCMRGVFYSVDDGRLIMSNEAKTVAAVTAEQINRLEPGQTLTADSSGTVSITPTADSETSSHRVTTRDDAIDSLASSLREEFSCLRKEKVGVLFSGGVDSGLVALLSSQYAKKTVLFSVSAETSRDHEAAVDAADALGLPLVVETIDEELVWKMLPSVIYAIESSRRMDVAIALPFLVAARAAAKRGIRLMVSGQGPDELFAGYARHVRIMQDGGPRALDEQLRTEVAMTHRTNLERDERAVAHGGCDLFYPYMSRMFIDYALAAPSEWKVSLYSEPQRKTIFRRLAIEMGLPRKIATARKSATQFSSGSDRLIVDAVRSHTVGTSIGRRRASSMVQPVLDEIAFRLGVAPAPSSPPSIDADWSSVDQFLRALATGD